MTTNTIPSLSRDYYRLSAILRSAYDPYDWLSPNEADIGPDADWNETNSRLLPGAPANDVEAAAQHNAPIEKEAARLAADLAALAAPVRQKLLDEKVPSVANDVLVELTKLLSKSLPEDVAASAEAGTGTGGSQRGVLRRGGLAVRFIRQGKASPSHKAQGEGII